VGASGVVVGALPAGTSVVPALDHVTSRSFTAAAILVDNGGAVVIDAGMSGTASNDGLSIARGGEATVALSTGGDPTT
jgi:hypothetical protein